MTIYNYSEMLWELLLYRAKKSKNLQRFMRGLLPTPLLKVQINLFTMYRLSVIQCLFLKLLLADSCFICGKSAQRWCADCMAEVQQFENPVYFCLGCSESIHGHPHRIGHKVEMAQARLELLSVICIETSHYVCFTRAENRWIFFDSMANRACKW